MYFNVITKNAAISATATAHHMPFIPKISGRIKNASNSNTILLSTEIIAANLIGVSENLSNLSLGFMKYASDIRPPIDALKPVAIAAPAFYLLITIL